VGENENGIIKLLIEHSSLGVVICDKSEYIIDSNNFVSDLLGVDKENLISKKFSQFFYIVSDSEQYKYQDLKSYITDSNEENPKVAKIRFNNKLKEPLEVLSHIYIRNLGEDLYILCLFDSLTPTALLDEFVKKYSTSICHRNGGQENYFCNSIDELMNICLLLSKEVNKNESLRKNVEYALEREKQHSEFKTRFVSIASHELRTPLGGILTSASLIEKYNTLGTPEQRQKHIEIIKGQVRVLTSILDDFLSLDKFERPEVRIHLKMFSLDEFFEEFFQSYSGYQNVERRLVYEHIGGDLNLYQDSDLLLKILNNLVSNGLKYSRDDQLVNITSQVIGRNIEIKIKDSGIGIPESEKDSIWELFYRAENTSGIQGTGLGLNIARLCSHLIEGTISFTSKKNSGTEFVLLFPKELSI
jgi:signal transduction histidine kinase